MGQLTHGYSHDPSQPSWATREVMLGDGLLKFQYCEDGPGERPAQKYERHCLVIPVQRNPIRVLVSRNGKRRAFTLNADDIALAPAGTETAWQWLDPANVVLIWIDPVEFRKFVELEMRLLLDGNSLEEDIVITDPDLSSAAKRMRNTILGDEIGSQIVFEALARVFLVVLVRHYGKPARQQVEFTSEFRVQDYTSIVEFVERRLGRRIGPKDMAAHLGMSEAVFSRKFKRRVGKTPMRFVWDIRLERAASLIVQDQISLGEVAIRCGFSDQAHFSRKFKEAYGIAPRLYRKEPMRSAG